MVFRVLIGRVSRNRPVPNHRSNDAHAICRPTSERLRQGKRVVSLADDDSVVFKSKRIYLFVKSGKGRKMECRWTYQLNPMPLLSLSVDLFRRSDPGEGGGRVGEEDPVAILLESSGHVQKQPNPSPLGGWIRSPIPLYLNSSGTLFF